MSAKSAKMRQLTGVPNGSVAGAEEAFRPASKASTQSDVLGPEGDTWSFYVTPSTLECSASTSLNHNPWNKYQTTGYCGTFVAVDNIMYGMEVQNRPFQLNSAWPLPYTVVSRQETGIATTTVVDAGTTGIRITQTDTYNTEGDGWITHLKVQNLGSETRLVKAMHISGPCAYWVFPNNPQSTYDATTGQTSCVNGLNTVTYIRREPGGGVYTGSQSLWGHVKSATLAPGENLEFAGEIVWRKDGTLPVPPPPLPDWYGPSDPLTAAGGGSPDTNTAQCSCADPVNTATGELWETVTDLSLPGRLPVEATRTYSSLRAGQPGLFGEGWTSPWDMRIVAGNPTTIVHQNGSQTTVAANADGTFSPDPDTFATLTRDPGSGIYTYVPRNGNSYTFDTNGRLSAVTDRNLESTTLAWGASSVAIASSDGRTLTLTLNPDGTASELSGPGGRTVGYRYDANGHLDQVTDPRGKAWAYAYDAADRMVSNTSPLLETTTTRYDGQGRVASQDNRRGGTTSFDYTVDGATTITRVTDPVGVVTDYGYDYGMLSFRTIDPAGAAATWTYTYDLDGNQTTATTPTGERTTARYDQAGNATSRTDEAGNSTTFTYNQFNEPLTATDPDSVVTTWTYDAAGNLASVSTPRAGVPATTSYARSSAHPADVVSVTDPDARVTTMTYTAAGLAESLTAADTGKRTWTRNPYGQPLTTVSPRGNAAGATPSQYTTTTTYDSAGNESTVTDPLGFVTTYGYDDDSRPTTVTDAYSKTTATGYFPDGTVESVTDPLDRTTSHTYDLAGNLLTTTAPNGALTSQSYESHGWLRTLVKPSGNAPGATPAQQTARTLTTTYDLSGKVTAVSQPDPANPGQDLISTTTYDTAGRPAATSNPAGETTSFYYSYRMGRLETVRDPAGKDTEYAYDEFGDLVQVTDPLDRATVTTYTPGGLVASVTDPANQITQYTFDPAGRVKTVIDPRGACSGCAAANYTTTYSYDLNGSQTVVADQLGRATTNAYDRSDRLITVTDAKNRRTDYSYDNVNRLKTVTAPDSGVTALGYDYAGQHISTQNPRLKTSTYGYDANGRPTSSIDPLLRETSRTYTEDGQLKTTVTARGNAGTPAAGTISYDYDDAGRLSTAAFGDGATTLAYGYDKASRRISMTDAAGTQTRGYDPNGRLTALTRGSSTWGYTYNDDGTTATVTRPDATVETWTYDTAARPTKVVAPAGTTTFTFDKASNLTKSTHPNGTTETQTWDRAGYLATLVTKKGATTRVSQTVTRDTVNKPTQIAVTRGTSSGTRSFLYDPNDRLQGVCYLALTSCTGSSAATQWWTYDKNGNRVTEKNGTGTGTTTTYTSDDADQLTSRKVGTAAAIPLTYDADGNVLTDGTTTWTYDLTNRTTSSKVGATTTNWQRDGDGNLTQQAAGAALTTYDWDLNHTVPRLAAAIAAGATTSYRYDPAGRAASLTAAATTETIGHDLLGAPTDLLSAAGATVRSYDYTPFGTSRTAVGAPTTPTGPATSLQYAGMLTSGANSTYAARDRTYDPTTARWSGVDPVLATVSTPYDSRYTYVGNQATLYIDPLGQLACDLFSWGGEGCVAQATLNAPGADLLAAQGEFIAGAGDTLTFGASKRVRQALGWEKAVDECGWLYRTGEVSALVAPGAGAVAGAVKGVRALRGWRSARAAEGAPLAIAASTRVAPWAGSTLSRVTSADEVMYRVWGGNSARAGEWLTPIRPQSSAAARAGLALPGENAATYVSRVVVPAGTRIQVGPAGEAFGQSGGWAQAQLLERIPVENFGKGVLLGP